jgi:hypothetical protein
MTSIFKYFEDVRFHSRYYNPPDCVMYGALERMESATFFRVPFWYWSKRQISNRISGLLGDIKIVTDRSIFAVVTC